MKWFLPSIIVIVIILGLLYMSKNEAENVTFSLPQQKSLEILRVPPQQEPKTTVFIERIAITYPGFLAVRSLENGRLGQIVEISPYLPKGEHKNITINLGEFYDGKTDLIVVAYQDAQNDQIFNDLDQPMVNSDNNVIARYVKTGAEVPSEMFASSGESTPHTMGGVKMETVRYTNQGYVPERLEVSLGTMVQFINESDSSMWVASNEHPGHTDLPTFDQFSPSVKTSVYHYTFDQVGTWYFHDHLKPEFSGVINVI